MALQHSPSIVTSGLALCLDAGNPRSYAGSGTTWRDLSNNGFNGSILNGTSYVSGINGYFNLDGVDDYISCGNVLASLTNMTLECWVNFSTQISNYNGIISKTLSNADGYEIRTTGYTPTTTSFQFRYKGDTAVTNEYAATNGLWYNIVATGQSGSQRLIVNNVLQASNTVVTTPTANSNNLEIGKLSYSGLYLKGSMAVAKIYDRVLSDSEISQNFNALRGRYGI
jgi:hypothetical protein